MKKTIFILTGGILIIAAAIFISVTIFSNSKKGAEELDSCKPGEKFQIGPFGERFCYTPSGFQGKPCDKQTDCGVAQCRLIDENKTTGRGICEDVTYGCVRFIDKNGSLGPTLCID